MKTSRILDILLRRERGPFLAGLVLSLVSAYQLMTHEAVDVLLSDVFFSPLVHCIVPVVWVALLAGLGMAGFALANACRSVPSQR
ncbi:MAG: hypothetical protein PGN26_11640 [Xylophilus ampelinus]